MLTNPITFKKAVATALGRNYNDTIAIQEETLTSLAPDELLIKNKFAGVNASDLNMMAGLYFADAQLPFDLGFEFAGEVAAVGSEVENFKVGQPVIGIKTGGGYREYVTMKAAEVIPVPEATPQAMSLITVGLAASIGLKKVGEMSTGETVLVTAAAGGTGNIAVQLAKLAGNHVIATCSTDEKVEMLKELGCDRVINYKKEDLDEVLTKEYPQGINIVFENVGGQTFDTCVKHLAVLGRLLVCGFVSEYQQNEPSQITSPRIYHQLLWKSASVRGFLFSHYPELIPQHLQEMMGLMAEGKLKVQIDPTEFKGVENLPKAMDHLFEGKNKGKVVLSL
jgi:NADPH-dependent curcumin reductase CurA